MASVHLHHVSKSFVTRKKVAQAVRDLCLDVCDRQFLVLVGPSGCGKTTTLRLIAGLDDPTEGTIHIDHRDVTRTAPKDRNVAMVFQNYALYPHMTVYQNLAFALKMRHTPKAEIKRKVEEVAGVLRITPLLDRKPASLSGGEKQRVAVGRAIVRRPTVFLFDEPLANLDAQLRLHMRSEIKTLHRDLQATMIYVTHDQEEAMALGDRIVVMRAGVIQQSGAPLDVYHRPANRFVAGFLGNPPMNFLPGRLQHDGGTARFDGEALRFALPSALISVAKLSNGQPVVLGIRPEDLSLTNPQPPSGKDPTASRMDSDQPDSAFATLTGLSIRWIEPLGGSTHLHLATATEQLLVASVLPSVSPRTGQRVDVRLNLSHVHIFEADERGNRLV